MVKIAKTGDIIEWMGNNYRPESPHLAPGVVVATVEVESPYPACRREFRIQWLDFDWIKRSPYENRTIMRFYCPRGKLF